MLELKGIIKNKLDSLIIIIIILVSLTGVNILFNIFFNAYITSKQSEKFSRSHELVTLDFNNLTTSKDINNFLRRISDDNINFLITQNIELKGELFDKMLNINLISSSDVVDYKVIEGRSITKEDIEKKEKVIVLPKKYKELFYKKNENYFIDIQGDPYKIIGVTDDTYSENFYSYKAFIPYNFDGAFNDGKFKGLSFISNSTRDSINRTLIKENIVESIKFSPIQYDSLKSLINNLEDHFKYYFIIALLCILNFIIFLTLFIRKRNKTIGILRAIGYSKKRVSIIFRNQIMVLCFIASIISWIVYYPFSNFFNKGFMHLGLVASSLILIFDIFFVLILMLIVQKILFYLINRNSINQNISLRKNIFNGILIKAFLIVQVSLMFNYSIDTYDTYKNINSTLYKAKNILDFEKTLVINPFSISYDYEKLKSYNFTDTINELKNNNIKTINYIYSIDSSEDVKNLNDLSYDIDINFIGNIPIQDNNDLIPLLYIDKDSFSSLKIKKPSIIDTNEISPNIIPIYAGNNYKEKFKIGDKIQGNSNMIYEIIGFIEKDQYMFSENSGTEIMSTFNNLNSFFLIPFDLTNITKLKIPNLNDDEKLFDLCTNTLIKFDDNSQYELINNRLSSKNINTVSLDIQLNRYKFINFSYLKYTLFNSLIISIISFIGVICYAISLIYSERKNIGIKRALGFKSNKIIIQYTLNISIILITSIILVFLNKFRNEFFNLTTNNILIVLFLLIIILVSTMVITIYSIKTYKISDLIKGDD